MEQTAFRGVNLGGWLVLEKWLTPSMFTGIKGRDEYSFCQELGRAAPGLLAVHRDNFITEADFKWIASHGLNAVRLPVGYWIMGGQKPFVGGIEYVDQALIWAERYGLKVVIDLHGAPGSQNGRDHSGWAGRARWGNQDSVDKTLNLLDKLCALYAGVPSLVGIELLNEPSRRLRRHTLRQYYERGYKTVRKHLGQDVSVIIPDQFRPRRWQRELTGPDFHGVVLDVHFYQIFGLRDKIVGLERQLTKALRRRRLVARLQKTRPTIIGEWTAALPPSNFRGLSNSAKSNAYRSYAAAQLTAYAAAGWFYWNYKTETGGPWSYRDGVKRGWLPVSASSSKT